MLLFLDSEQERVNGLGQFVQENDELDIRVDLIGRTLSYQTNEKGYFVAHRNIPMDKMRVAMSLCHGFTIQMISSCLTYR